jgi:hypothetical protein
VKPDSAEALRCVECSRERAADDRGWKAYLTTDEHEPAEAVVFCPSCAERSSVLEGPLTAALTHRARRLDTAFAAS